MGDGASAAAVLTRGIFCLPAIFAEYLLRQTFAGFHLQATFPPPPCSCSPCTMPMLDVGKDFRFHRHRTDMDINNIMAIGKRTPLDPPARIE
jgi:hypothetical protein